MADEWDLSAIVRSCQSATVNATKEIPLTTTTTTTSSLAPCTTTTVKEDGYDAFSFPNLLQPITDEFQDELNQLLLTPFDPTTNNNTPIGVGINPNSPDSAGCTGQHEAQQLQHLPHPFIIWPHLLPEASTSGFNRFRDQHQSLQQNQLQLVPTQESQVPQSSSATVLLDTRPQTPRSRKRRSQQKRMVCHVTADNLSADMWAWRKYGQKPIKGSPYPRNYYRCSSSKGCSARKQVERSNEEPNTFIITYTGDHNHARPTHRNSLAGSTRSKPSTPATHGSPPSQATAATTTAFVAPPPPPSALSPPPENEEIEPESPDPETETDVEGEGDAEPGANIGNFQPSSNDSGSIPVEIDRTGPA